MIMGRKKGATNNTRNNLIIDLHKKNYSYNQINRELIKNNYFISLQRIAKIIKQGIKE
tara:strand:+ start:509 stop:682 length:174 start_codon:yes stop_codon:yes gene_type:complete